ncbi:MAG: hypothetical protein RL607_244 [Bacteroidota bacterium]
MALLIFTSLAFFIGNQLSFSKITHAAQKILTLSTTRQLTNPFP